MSEAPKRRTISFSLVVTLAGPDRLTHDGEVRMDCPGTDYAGLRDMLQIALRAAARAAEVQALELLDPAHVHRTSVEDFARARRRHWVKNDGESACGERRVVPGEGHPDFVLHVEEVTCVECLRAAYALLEKAWEKTSEGLDVHARAASGGALCRIGAGHPRVDAGFSDLVSCRSCLWQEIRALREDADPSHHFVLPAEAALDLEAAGRARAGLCGKALGSGTFQVLLPVRSDPSAEDVARVNCLACLRRALVLST